MTTLAFEEVTSLFKCPNDLREHSSLSPKAFASSPEQIWNGLGILRKLLHRVSSLYWNLRKQICPFRKIFSQQELEEKMEEVFLEQTIDMENQSFGISCPNNWYDPHFSWIGYFSVWFSNIAYRLTRPIHQNGAQRSDTDKLTAQIDFTDHLAFYGIGDQTNPNL